MLHSKVHYALKQCICVSWFLFYSLSRFGELFLNVYSTVFSFKRALPWPELATLPVALIKRLIATEVTSRLGGT